MGILPLTSTEYKKKYVKKFKKSSAGLYSIFWWQMLKDGKSSTTASRRKFIIFLPSEKLLKWHFTRKRG
jgi:hypothetical protein